MLPQGLGRKRHHRRRARASGTRPFQPVTGRVWRGTAARAAACRASSAMDGKTDIGDPITHTMPPDRINGALEPMHEGKSIRSVITF